MSHAGKVDAPPSKPLMIYDGDCRFCTLWIRRWQQMTGNKVDYLPFQDESVAQKFPELARTQFEAAVHLVETDGSVYRGAEAVFRSLTYSRGKAWPLKIYERSSFFAQASEVSYSLVARHRVFFSWLTRFAFGKHVEQPNHFLVRWIFLRGLGLIYLCAFLSLWTQIIGLAGSNGIVPANQFMAGAKQYFDQHRVGIDRYHQLPTLCWFSASDDFLSGLCAVGTVLSVILIFGIAPAPCLALLWLIYLSLCSVCSPFLNFQWDILLLETGLLAIFFAPLRLWPSLTRESPPSRIVLWLLRWLLFRLVFESGIVKLLSGDTTWKNLTALSFHYETQPLPTWIGWFAHQLPLWVHKISVVGMFGIELVVPFLIFAPRRIRAFACWVMIAFQVGIFLTGNYCFFNLLTILLCLTLLDDFALARIFRKRFREKFSADRTRANWRILARRFVTVPLAVLVVSVTGAELLAMFRAANWIPTPVLATADWCGPFRTFNSYGLFAVMTTSRPEIIVEGSNDGQTWLAYEFKYKAGDLKSKPRFVEPHQPRLDWQMWFAALGDYRGNHWFVNFCRRLLDGTPEVLALLEKNPFPDKPPRYIRARLFDYHFTTPAERNETGDWWKCEFVRDYLPVVSRENFR